jgi:predicted Fe-Mo cluster-binding NifX family protein
LRIAVSATDANPDAAVDPRFGRCPCFVIVDTETLEFEAVPNTSQYAPSGAGIQSAQIIANKGAKVVLTGSVGPNAYQALSAAGIQIITGVFGTIKEAVEKFKSGQLRQATAPTAQMGFGMGGFGMGTGHGSGRGMGRGRGTGTFAPSATMAPVAPAIPTAPMPREQEIQMLEDQMKILRQQLEQIKKRMKELEKK